MAEELRSNLSSYKVQLQQVDASLDGDPKNGDLLKLKKDLQEVIALTAELLKQQKDKAAAVAVPDGADSLPEVNWSVGDRCMAIWSHDSQYYPARVEEVLSDGSCTVTFTDYDQSELTQTALLKLYDERLVQQRSEENERKRGKSKHDQTSQQREYKRKKSQKKAQRMKQIEEEHETDKKKWVDFNVKTFSKTNKGKVKRSIFATSEHVTGRVGVGTCGVSGKPMTHYTMQKSKRT